MQGRHYCQVSGCNWITEIYEEDITGCLATWHVFEEHPEVWKEIIGDRPPIDPDPRTEAGMAEIIRGRNINAP